jgi:hypothetical protein
MKTDYRVKKVQLIWAFVEHHITWKELIELTNQLQFEALQDA